MKFDKFYVFGTLYLAILLFWQLFSPLPTTPLIISPERDWEVFGHVVTEPVQKETYLRYEVTVPELSDTRFLIYDDLASPASYGDTLTLVGNITQPENKSGFDWVAYLARRNIFYEMRFPDVKKNNKIHAPFFVSLEKKLLSIKYAFSEKLSRVIPEPAATLAAGELLGEKRLLDKELSSALMISGVSHIVVLSGYNITIVSESILRALSFLPRAFAFCGAFTGIILFVAIAGFGASVMRAALMASILLIARQIGALHSAKRALFIVAIAMVTVKPMLIAYDASFQLSFLATAGILYGQSYFEKKFSHITSRFSLRETLATTVAAQSAVLPLLINLSGGVQVFSVLANMLILPVVPLTMLLSLITGLFGFFSYSLSQFFGMFTTLILSYQLVVISTIGTITWANVPLPQGVSLVAGIFYILFFVYILWKEEK